MIVGNSSSSVRGFRRCGRCRRGAGAQLLPLRHSGPAYSALRALPILLNIVEQRTLQLREQGFAGWLRPCLEGAPSLAERLGVLLGGQ